MAEAPVRLEIPGDPAYVMAARVVAAWLVADAGASLDAVDDARLAVDEIVTACVASGEAVDVSFRQASQGLLVEVEQRRPAGTVALSPMARRVVTVAAEECAPLDSGRSGFVLTLRTT